MGFVGGQFEIHLNYILITINFSIEAPEERKYKPFTTIRDHYPKVLLTLNSMLVSSSVSKDIALIPLQNTAAVNLVGK